MTVEQALAHPTWAMGGKITIDSATLMNKGLELIEAHHLFGVPYERIDVVVHPQSIVHSLIDLCDGASLAHLGYPDMRVPISYALHHPERVDVPVAPLDLAELGALTFERVDEETFAVPAAGPRGGGGRRHRAVRAQRRQRGRRPRVPARPRGLPRHRRRGRGYARARGGGAGARVRVALRGRPRGARGGARARRAAGGGALSWLLAFAGFAALIILHEAGHFAAAKAVGMRVERFVAVLPAAALMFRRGETEYGIGAIPLGGYVKITGMNPSEEIPPRGRPPRLLPPAGVEADRGDRRRPGDEHPDRVRDPVGAPALTGTVVATRAQSTRQDRSRRPASCIRATGSSSIDGVRRRPRGAARRPDRRGPRCPGRARSDGCTRDEARARVVVRDGHQVALDILPHYDSAPRPRADAARVRFREAERTTSARSTPPRSTVTEMWQVTTRRRSEAIVTIFDPRRARSSRAWSAPTT